MSHQIANLLQYCEAKRRMKLTEEKMVKSIFYSFQYCTITQTDFVNVEQRWIVKI